MCPRWQDQACIRGPVLGNELGKDGQGAEREKVKKMGKRGYTSERANGNKEKVN
jgi:hypothetical protein